MPSAKAVASSGVTAISRSARMPTTGRGTPPPSHRRRVEGAGVPVEGAGERDGGVRVEAPGGQRRREGVEVGVRMRDDDVHAYSVVGRPGGAPQAWRGRPPRG